MIIISVDLGLTGYISVLKTFDNSINLESKYKIIVKTKKDELTTKSNYSVKKEIDFKLNDNLIKKIKNDYPNNDFVLLFEQVSTRLGFSTSSAMSLADTQSCFRCLANNNDINYEVISPQKWKKYLSISKDKKESQELIQKLINSSKITHLNTSLIKNHNFIESVLIGYYYYNIKLK